MRNQSSAIANEETGREQVTATQVDVRRWFQRMADAATKSHATMPSSTQRSRMHKAIYSI